MTRIIDTDENDIKARSVYAWGWAVHQLLQLYQQAFLFDSETIHRLVLLTVLLVFVFPRQKSAFLIALIIRNVARIQRCPFLWDSEFWLALTDLTVLTLSLLPTYFIDLRHHPEVFVKGVLPCMRVQLAIQYLACALFKLNTAFLRRHTSCAPIFVLSLLVKAWPETSTSIPNWILTLIAQVAPWSVVVVEGLVGSLLLFDGKLHDFGIGLALVFHALIAITPRPNGVPTFSCVAVSRLFLLIGYPVPNNNNNERWSPPVVRVLLEGGGIGRAMIICVAVAAVAIHVTRDAAVVLYFVWSSLCLLALLESRKQLCNKVCADNKDDVVAKNTSTGFRWTKRLLVGLALFYGFLPPIFGLQEIGSNTMFANLRLHGGSNHIWGLPTGLLQQWWYRQTIDADDNEITFQNAWWYDVFGGGVVRVEYTDSPYLNQLYPGEMTEWLRSDLHTLLMRIGHVGRQFNPKARRVLGPKARQSMPQWKPQPKSNATIPVSHDSNQFVKYTVPALEFRRLLHEARAYALATNQSFEIEYTRLIGAIGDEDWRRTSKGIVVRLENDTGEDVFDCVHRDRRVEESNWERCHLTELPLLPPPPWWALKFMLFYPYAIFSEREDDRDFYVDELLCNY